MAWLTTPSVWYRRKPKLVRGSTAGAQIDYQLKLTIYKTIGTDTDTTVYLGTYINNDFSDLRFTSSDETTLLPYYIESYTSGVSAVVWVKIDSIPADPFTKFIYIYYDNPVASSASNYAVVFLYATGGNITYSGNDTIHTFLTNGTFTPYFTGNVKALVVAGGGGGGYAGGGAGGLLYNSSVAVTGGTPYTATIGSGGAAKTPGVGVQGNPGNNSIFRTLTATGGGGGGGQNIVGANGGSGGGGGVSNVSYAGGTGVAGQGFAGGINTTVSPYAAGGGGGASQVGSNANGAQSGNGGNGSSNSITGVATFYAGGGGGFGDSTRFPGSGGSGGGGTGSPYPVGGSGTAGTANTGGGGGGGIGTNGGATGGSGIVIVRYLNRSITSPEPTFSTTSSEQTYTANLTVSSTPTGAEIWINNIDQMVTTTSWYILNPGTYTIKLIKSGYNDYIETITLSSNQNAIVQGNLIPTTGNLDISSTPPGAEIFLGPTGSPLVDQGIVTPSTISLSPLTYDYKLTHIDYYDTTGSFTITSGYTTILNISLTPLLCPISPKYSGNTITLKATPKDGIGPYYVVFSKDGVIIDSSRLGGLDNPIFSAPENTLITRVYTLDDLDISSASTGTIDFSVYMEDSCPTTPRTCTDICTITIGCISPVCNFTVT